MSKWHTGHILLESLEFQFVAKALVKLLLDWMLLCHQLVFLYGCTKAAQLLGLFYKLHHFRSFDRSLQDKLHDTVAFFIVQFWFLVKKWMFALDCILVLVLEMIEFPHWVIPLKYNIFVTHIQQIIHYIQSYYFPRCFFLHYMDDIWILVLFLC